MPRCAGLGQSGRCRNRPFRGPLHRQRRAQRARAPESRHGRAPEAAAQGHSEDMNHRDYFSHESPEGRNVWDRVTDQGYDYATVGENIYSGPTTAFDLMKGWMASTGHCRNILDPAYTDSDSGSARRFRRRSSAARSPSRSRQAAGGRRRAAPSSSARATGVGPELCAILTCRSSRGRLAQIAFASSSLTIPAPVADFLQQPPAAAAPISRREQSSDGRAGC